MKTVEWVVERREDDIVMIALDEEEEGDVTYYVISPTDAGALAGALIDTIEEGEIK